ncbi:cytochrome-b5 reductase [Pancytospora philotis]|nr:cytochrome-b5 reductase [Pancytospora philotis]
MAHYTVQARAELARNVFKLVLSSESRIDAPRVCSFLNIFNGDGVSRPYTPTHIGENTLELAVKAYDGGAVSEYLRGLSVGDTVAASDFAKKREYRINEHRDVLMVCGGTGVTPMLQILDRAMRCPDSTTRFTLLFFNTEPADIFMSDEIGALQRLKPDGELRARYICTGSEGDKKDHAGSRVVIRDEVAGEVRANTFDFAYVCGTPGFLAFLCGPKTKTKEQGELLGVFKELGFGPDAVYKF